MGSKGERVVGDEVGIFHDMQTLSNLVSSVKQIKGEVRELQTWRVEVNETLGLMKDAQKEQQASIDGNVSKLTQMEKQLERMQCIKIRDALLLFSFLLLFLIYLHFLFT